MSLYVETVCWHTNITKLIWLMCCIAFLHGCPYTPVVSIMSHVHCVLLAAVNLSRQWTRGVVEAYAPPSTK